MSASRCPWLAALVIALSGVALSQPTSAIRFAHLSPDAPTADLVIDSRLFLRDVVYGQVTPYRALPAGQHEISVFPHRLPNGGGEEADDPLELEPITILLDLSDGMYYTLAISGFYQRPGEDEETGRLSLSVEPENAEVQVSGPRGYTRSFQGEAVLDELEPGGYGIRVEAGGYSPATFETSISANETATVSISLQSLEGGGVAGAGPTVETAGAVSDWQPVQLHAFRDELAATPPPGGSRIRLLHMSPTTLPVDLLALPDDGAGEPVVIASDLSFPNASSYVRLPGSEHTLQVRLAGADAILSEVPLLETEPGGTYSLYLVREPEDNYLRLVPSVDAMITVRR